MSHGRFSRRVRLSGRHPLWWAVAAVLAILLAASYVRLWPRVNNKDWRVYVEAGAALARGGDIYADTEPFRERVESGAFDLKDPDVRWPYAYPPLAAILAVPLAGLPYEPLALAWTVANVLMLVAAGWLCLLALPGRALPGRALPGQALSGQAPGPVEPLDVAMLGAILYAFYPATVSLRLGQLEILQLLLLAGAYLGLKRGRSLVAGLLLGVATALKFFPGALIAFLLWKRLWRPALVGLAVALALLAGSFAVVGFEQVPRYLAFTSLYSRGAFGAFPLNQSLHGFFARNLTANPFVVPLKGWHLPWLADGATLALSALLVGGWAALCARPLDPPGSQRFDLEFSGAIALLLLVSPHSQVYAFVWLLAPLLVLAYRLRRAGPGWAWPLAIVAYALVGRRYELYRPGLTRFVVSHVMFGALLLLVVMGALLWAMRPRRDAAGDRQGAGGEEKP